MQRYLNCILTWASIWHTLRSSIMSTDCISPLCMFTLKHNKPRHTVANPHMILHGTVASRRIRGGVTCGHRTAWERLSCHSSCPLFTQTWASALRLPLLPARRQNDTPASNRPGGKGHWDQSFSLQSCWRSSASVLRPPPFPTWQPQNCCYCEISIDRAAQGCQSYNKEEGGNSDNLQNSTNVL